MFLGSFFQIFWNFQDSSVHQVKFRSELICTTETSVAKPTAQKPPPGWGLRSHEPLATRCWQSGAYQVGLREGGASASSRPVLIGGPGWGWLFCSGARTTWEKKKKSLIQTKQCLQFQQFSLGSKLLRYFISTFPFKTKPLLEICHCIIDADSLSGGPQGGSRLRVTALAPVAPPTEPPLGGAQWAPFFVSCLPSSLSKINSSLDVMLYSYCAF